MDLTEKLISSSTNSISILATDIKNPRLCIIETHGGIEGNKENVAKESKLQNYCSENNIAYIAYNPSHNGTQDSQPLNEVLFSKRTQDLVKVISYVRSAYNCPILLIGTSLGGLVTINVASQNPEDIIGLVINCGVINPEDTLKKIAGEREFNSWETHGTAKAFDINLPFEFLTDIKDLKTEDKLTSLKIPILWFHGTKDELSSIDSIRVSASVNTDIKLIEIANGGHRFGSSMEPGLWEKEVEIFIENLMSL